MKDSHLWKSVSVGSEKPVGAPGFAIVPSWGNRDLKKKAPRGIKPRGGEKMIDLVGAPGFEPGTSASRTQRSNRAEPRPELASRDYTRPRMI